MIFFSRIIFFKCQGVRAMTINNVFGNTFFRVVCSIKYSSCLDDFYRGVLNKIHVNNQEFCNLKKNSNFCDCWSE